MRKIELGKSKMMVPVVAAGCMRLNGLELKAAVNVKSFSRRHAI